MGQSQPIEVDCYLVRRELVNWMEGDLTPELRADIALHLKNCEHCTAVYDGARNVVRLLSDKNAIDLPPGFSQRLYVRLMRTQ
ncbi:MAG: zf-HC2 domain-containing protein [Acidobacteria bacterium]|nr:zf-HC2 domain-containing protein [Acidobacteriota bacterium]